LKSNPWFPLNGGAPDGAARIRVVCFPYAGGGAAAFRSLREGLKPGFDVWPLELPGRLSRMAEQPATRFAPLVPVLTEQVIAAAQAQPYVLLGYSMGSALAFEVARELRRRGLRAPRALLVAAGAAPHVRRSDYAAICDLPDPVLCTELQRRWGPLPDAVLREPDLLEMVLRVTRADLRLASDYSYRAEEPFDFPIGAIGGERDPGCTTADLLAWSSQTRGRFEHRLLPGGHFFINDDPRAFLVTTRELLGLCCAESSG
jgi:surfactin synthase thioesterase subunit